MSEKIKIFIGIDPDVDKSGFAVWDKEEKTLEVSKKTFWEMIEGFQSRSVPFRVIIEAGWLINKSNWHGNSGQSKRAGERIAKNVGSNHQVGKLIEQYCIKNDIPYSLVKPKGKVSAEYFKKVTGHSKGFNQDMRDAAMLVYGM